MRMFYLMLGILFLSIKYIRMRYLCIAFLVLFQLGTSFSQCCPYLGEMSIIPDNPTTLDSVYLVTNVTTPNVGLYLGYEIETGSNNHITVTACYWRGNATALQDFTDTINLGVQEAGSYTLEFIAISSISDTSCVFNDSNATDLTFDVTMINNTKLEEQTQVSIYPNPISNQELLISSSNQILSITILNIQGEEIRKLNNIKSDKVTLDIQDLTSGSYVVKIIDQQNNATLKKLVKLD